MAWCIIKHRGNFIMFVCLCFRRLKRWIFEKQQKGVQGTRRHRHKSVGDVETNLPKNKRQQLQFAQAIEVGTSPAKNVAECMKKTSNFKVVFILCRQHAFLYKGRSRERETGNTIHQHPEAKHTAESIIKITGSITSNTVCIMAWTKHKK
jgi:hypothetical protein